MHPDSKDIISLSFSMLLSVSSLAQVPAKDSATASHIILDSLFIFETEARKSPEKVLHAEPLFIDLIRDLGARKGEKEWNIAIGITDRKTYDFYSALIEYEFAPVDRLGLEVELPFSFYMPLDSAVYGSEVPASRLNSIKLAAQYSFFVNLKRNTSAAFGYIHEFDQAPFNRYGKDALFTGHVFNPFLVVAKRWGSHLHTLVYTGPLAQKERLNHHTLYIWQLNSNLHYMIPGTRNFVGLEFNKTWQGGDFDMTANAPGDSR